MSYSGGECTTNNDGSLSTSGYTSSSYSTYGAYNYFFWGTKNNGTQTTTSSVTCAGEITATFTWIPDDPNDPNDVAPAQAVVRETSSGKWWSYSSPNAFAVGLSDNDLSDEDSSFPYVPGGTTSPNASQANPHGVSQGTRYKIQEEAGASFTVKCSPDSTASGTGSLNPAGSGYGLVEVSYSASAEPLEIVLDGGIGPKDAKKYLIGQKVTANLITGGLTASIFNWSISGGEVFKSYFAGKYQAVLEPFGSVFTNPISFFFKRPSIDDGESIVTCTTNLAVPTGALPTNGLNVTVSRNCEVLTPDNTLSASIGTVQLNPNGYPPRIELAGGGTPPYQGGIVWTGSVTTPTPFVMAYDDTGGWNFTQTIVTNRVAQSVSQSVTTTHERSLNGVEVLDTSFGYEPVYPSLHLATGFTHSERDTPGALYYAPLTKVEVYDDFQTYTLYLPPGGDSVFVPLKTLSWDWSGVVDRNPPGSTWVLSAGVAGVTPVTDLPDHPQWDDNIKCPDPNQNPCIDWVPSLPSP